MSEYSLPFAEKLAKTAMLVAEHGLDDPDAKRTVLYLSLLSTEISLKAMLEQAGTPIPKIRKRSHDLSGLLRDVSRCRVDSQAVSVPALRVPASCLRGRVLDFPPAKPTVGKIIDAGAKGASQYPGGVRYGESLRHFPPELVARMANEVIAFAKQHWQTIRTT